MEDLLMHFQDLGSLGSLLRADRLEPLRSSVIGFQGDLAKRDEQITQMQAEFETKRGDCESKLREQSTAHKEEKEELSNVYLKSVTEVKEQLKTCESQLAQLQEEMKEKETTFQDMKQRLDEMFSLEEKYSLTEQAQALEIEQQQQKIKDLEGDANEKRTEIKKLETVIEEHQQTVKKLGEGLEDKSTEITKLNSHNEKHQQTIKNLADDADGKGTEIKNLIGVVQEHEQTIRNLETDASNKDAEINKLNDDIEQQRQEINKIRIESEEELHRVQTDFNAIRRYIPLLKDENVEQLSEKLRTIWVSSLTAFERCFEEDLPESVLKNSKKWEHFGKSTRAMQLLPALGLLQSNSDLAKEMRVMLMLAILAEALVRHIFTVSYLFWDDSKFRKATIDLAWEDPDGERWTRGSLLSVGKELQVEGANENKEGVVDHVMDYARPLLGDAQFSLLRSTLTEIVQETINIWSRVQRWKVRFEADIDDGSDWGWQQHPLKSLPLYHPTGASHTPDEPSAPPSEYGISAVIFPRVFAVSERLQEDVNDDPTTPSAVADDGEDDLEDEYEVPVFPGIVITKPQSQAAINQLRVLKEQAKAHAYPPVTRSASIRARPRRSSTLPTPPASLSPTSANGTNSTNGTNGDHGTPRFLDSPLST